MAVRVAIKILMESKEIILKNGTTFPPATPSSATPYHTQQRHTLSHPVGVWAGSLGCVPPLRACGRRVRRPWDSLAHYVETPTTAAVILVAD